MSVRPASDLVQQVEESVRARRLLRDGQRVLVAVSGGLDSVVLLHVLHALAARHRWGLVVAHFNHQLRGAASAADERFVRALARRLRRPCICGRWPKAGHARAQELGLEMAARLARHAFLAEAAASHRCPVMALAHHADDQVELFFLRLLRGAGGEGLGGMKWSGRGWAGRGLTLVRPLLNRTRDELALWAREQGIRHREDATNLDRNRDRNWIRHELIPRLAARFGHAPAATVLRSMELVGADADFAERAAEDWLQARRRTAFARLPPALQRQVVRLQLRRLGVAADFDLVERLRLCPGQPVTAPGGVEWRRDAAGTVLRRETRPADFDSGQIGLELARPGSRRFGGATVTWRVSRGVPAAPTRSRAGREFFDADMVGPAVRLRHWRPGDRFQPIGMAGAVKLQDLFTNLKIPAGRRRVLLVAEAAGGDIFWVEGVRIGEQYKLGPRTRRTLEWRWRRI